MSSQDCISKLINVINNAYRADKQNVKSIFSKINFSICSILEKEGYISSYSKIEDFENNKCYLNIILKYVDGKPAIQMFKKVSKSSCRVYRGVSDLSLVMNGLGVLILSTSKGVITYEEAVKKNIGGELLCEVF